MEVHSLTTTLTSLLELHAQVLSWGVKKVKKTPDVLSSKATIQLRLLFSQLKFSSDALIEVQSLASSLSEIEAAEIHDLILDIQKTFIQALEILKPYTSGGTEGFLRTADRWKWTKISKREVKNLEQSITAQTESLVLLLRDSKDRRRTEDEHLDRRFSASSSSESAKSQAENTCTDLTTSPSTSDSNNQVETITNDIENSSNQLHVETITVSSDNTSLTVETPTPPTGQPSNQLQVETITASSDNTSLTVETLTPPTGQPSDQAEFERLLQLLQHTSHTDENKWDSESSTDSLSDFLTRRLSFNSCLYSRSIARSDNVSNFYSEDSDDERGSISEKSIAMTKAPSKDTSQDHGPSQNDVAAIPPSITTDIIEVGTHPPITTSELPRTVETPKCTLTPPADNADEEVASAEERQRRAKLIRRILDDFEVEEIQNAMLVLEQGRISEQRNKKRPAAQPKKRLTGISDNRQKQSSQKASQKASLINDQKRCSIQ